MEIATNEELMKELCGSRYIMNRLNKTEFGMDKGLAFTESGMARLENTLGILQGLYLAGGDTKDLSLRMLEDLRGQFSRLGCRDKTQISAWDKSYTFAAPNTICELYDDGTPFGWSFAMYSLVIDPKNEVPIDGQKVKQFRVAYENIPYRYVYNGGLLYYGPFGGETFSVAIDNPHFWSVHT